MKKLTLALCALITMPAMAQKYTVGVEEQRRCICNILAPAQLPTVWL